MLLEAETNKYCPGGNDFGAISNLITWVLNFFLSVADSRQVTCLEAENSVPDRLWYCPPSAAKLVIKSKYKLRPGPADLHLLVGS